MLNLNKKRLPLLLVGFLVIWLSIQYLLPIIFPFLLGVLLAFAAEPMVKRLSKKIPRPAASAIGVSVTLILLICVLVLLTAALVRELSLLANALPDLGQAAQGGLLALEGFLLRLSDRMPPGVRPLLVQSVTGFFNNGSAIVQQLLQRLTPLASSVLGWIPGSAIALGTGILSAFMVSARLLTIKQWLRELRSTPRLNQYLPMVKQVRTALGGWLKAQCKLIALCFFIVGAGLMILGVPHAPIWAFLIALVDAIPVLGTGTVLLPWSLISLLQGQSVKAIGLLGIYAVALLSRSILEPRLVGKQLGLDPLVTLIALYIGFQLWGIGGMLLSPIVCVVLSEISHLKAE